MRPVRLVSAAVTGRANEPTQSVELTLWHLLDERPRTVEGAVSFEFYSAVTGLIIALT